ncbi:MAG: hypothetical protein IJ796_09640 [Lachnospiraceae bacterium]|nr:hypothetical protein [Lachnospiraceae bacterium]
MGINGINNYSNFIGSYRIPSIPSVSVEDVKKQDEQRLAQQNQETLRPAALEDISLPAKPRNDAAPTEISLTFNKGEDYGYIGRDSDIYSLDVENAISDMRKDDVLKQYQYFVGNSGGGALVDNADGVVIPKVY